MTGSRDVDDLSLSSLGEAAILCQLPEGSLNFDRQRRIWALAESAEALPGVVEVVPGMNNLLVLHDPFTLSHAALSELLLGLWAKASYKDCAGSVTEIPTSYGGKAGEDLPEIAARAGLTPEEFVALHAAGDYVVYALGSQPGFAYLGGLDPRLATPRRSVPRPLLEAGCVIIGGEQTAVQSRTSPSGWNVIGKTDIEFFDATKAVPALLSPGSRLRFVVKEIVL